MMKKKESREASMQERYSIMQELKDQNERRRKGEPLTPQNRAVNPERDIARIMNRNL